MPTYDRLTALDESFLHLERAETPMHVGAVAILEREPFYGPDGRFRLDDVRALVESRLALLPRFRRRIMTAPLRMGRPIWVDDESFDMARHVRLTALPSPGDRRQLLALAERLSAQVLDRDRPLWEIWLIEGVDGGDRVGLIHKSHHTLSDGISGVDIAAALFDLAPEPTPPEPAAEGDEASRWVPEAAPDPVDVLVDTLRGHASRVAGLAGSARGVANAPRVATDRVVKLGRSIGALVGTAPVAPRLGFNASLAGGRRFETVTVQLDRARAVRRAFDCTVNDVMLAAVAGGVARLLADRGELEPGLVVKAFCPVSVRDDSERSQLGNRISTMIVPLTVGDPDARARLRAIRDATFDLKEREQALGAAAIIGLGEYAAPTLLGLAARAAHGQPFANLIVTNVPGPPVPLYLLGSRMLEVYPIVPLSRNLTLNVAVMSYCGQLHFGLIGDGGAARDLEVLAGGLEDAFDELDALARSASGE